MKRTKQDIQFWIQYDQANRDFLMNMSTFMTNTYWSVTAFLISSVSLVISFRGFDLYAKIISIIIPIVILIFGWSTQKKVNNMIENSKKANAQLQEELFKLYPEYKEKFH